MMKPKDSWDYVAILALGVSLFSLWMSYQNRQYDRLVAYEQKKQEVRQLFLEGELLLEKLENAVLEHVKNDKTDELRIDAGNILKKTVETHRDMKKIRTDFESLPATSDTETRLTLERIFSNQQILNKQLRESIETAKQRHGSKNEDKHDHRKESK
jgi:hypothetical protein